ncbi:DUF1461 domain-containing protein [Candidatus Woesearchaeota archaeon]|nr:DUF1461 domain-containing protein [Candidatus Woesearchaeota archaeon]
MKFSFLIPLIIIFLSLNLMVFNQDFYKQEMANYEQYQNPVNNLLDYFKGNSLDTEYYSEKEVSHLNDVRNLIWLSWVVIVLLCIPLVYSLLKDKKEHIRKQMLMGGIYSLILTILFSLTLISFSSSFTTFHEIIFTNNNWLLPASSTLIQMFPQEFFLQSTVQIVLYSLIFSLLCIVLGLKIPGEEKNAYKRT